MIKAVRKLRAACTCVCNNCSWGRHCGIKRDGCTR